MKFPKLKKQQKNPKQIPPFRPLSVITYTTLIILFRFLQGKASGEHGDRQVICTMFWEQAFAFWD